MLFVDEDRPAGTDEESLIEGIRSALLSRGNVLTKTPGVSVVLMEKMRKSEDGRSQFIFRSTAGPTLIDSLERFERDWLVDFIVRAGGGSHIKVRISVRRPDKDGPWDCYFWVPGTDAGDASVRLLTSLIMES